MLKNFLPNSLYGRFLLIILIPYIIVQVVAVYIFYDRHWSGVSRHMVLALAGDVLMVLEGMQKLDEEKFLPLASQNLYLKIKFYKGSNSFSQSGDKIADYPLLKEMLDEKITYPYQIHYLGDKSNVQIDIKLPNGILEVISTRKRLDNPSTYIFILWMTGTAIVFLIISVIFMRNQVKSITTLADIADKYGRGIDSQPIRPSGATEVRRVAKALINMKNRIKRQVQQRSDMLSGVSHDLKTPLTRMKLQLAMLDQSKAISELQKDVCQMEKMIHDYLDYAKGKEHVIDEDMDLSDLIKNIVSSYLLQNDKIKTDLKPDITLHINSGFLRRVFTNIIDNALKYGNNVFISTNATQKKVIIIIDDDGDGIDPEKYIEVFKPFYRLDSSRNSETGGTGLGLAIAKDIVTGYGGDISLDKSPQGGLRVVVKLPL